MRKLRRFGLAAVVAVAAAGSAVAQTTSSGGNLGTATSTSTLGTTIPTTSTLGTTTTGSTGSTGTSATGNNADFGAALSTVQPVTPLLPPSQTQTGSPNPNVQTSNAFRLTYGNPYSQGVTPFVTSKPPGGLGSTLYTSTGSTGTTGRGTTGFGNTGGTGGVSKPFSQSSTSGQIVQLPTQISYPAVVRFQAPVAPPTQVAADLRGMIDRSTMISNPRGVQVMTDATPGVIVLRGTVQDEDEAKTVEGMVRLTPGVRGVRNELTFPTALR